MTLRDVDCNNPVRVLRLKGQGATRRRIMDMGITKGTVICVRKVAPLGDPIEICVRGYSLSLRKKDAGMIEVEQVTRYCEGGKRRHGHGHQNRTCGKSKQW